MTTQHQPGRGRPSDGTGDRRPAPAAEHRPIAVIRRELAEVQRHLREVPPHHGGGAADLAARADGLQRELAAATAASRAEQAAQAQQQ